MTLSVKQSCWIQLKLSWTKAAHLVHLSNIITQTFPCHVFFGTAEHFYPIISMGFNLELIYIIISYLSPTILGKTISEYQKFCPGRLDFILVLVQVISLLSSPSRHTTFSGRLKENVTGEFQNVP